MEGAGVASGLGFAFLLGLSLLGDVIALTPAPTLADSDRIRYKSIFDSALASDVLDEALYGARGYAFLNERLSNGEKLCKLVKEKVDQSDVSSAFYATELIKRLIADGYSCELDLEIAQKTAASFVRVGVRTKVLHHAIKVLKNLGRPIGREAVNILIAALKEDDSPASYAHAFYAAANLLREDALRVHGLIEDVVAQVDEVGDNYCQFTDIATTAFVVDSIFSLSDAVGVRPAVAEDKVVKFGNYLLDRKQVSTIKEAYLVFSALLGLTVNKFYIPISMSLGGPIAISENSPKVVVKVCDLLGNTINSISVMADSGRHIADNAVILSKRALVQSKSDPSLYEFDLYELKPAVGFYRLFISVSPTQDGVKLLGNQENEIIVKVTTEVAIKDVEALVLDKEQGTILKNLKVEHPNKISVEVDFHQKFLLKFLVVDKKSDSPLTPHQAFVRLLNEKTLHEVIYVAEEDASKMYKFDLDIGTKGKDFNGLSGKYLVDLIVGDAVIDNPISWPLGEVKLTFSDDISVPSADPYLFSQKPEIKHIFREPEKRPATVVSNLFTGLVVVPFLILLGLWLKLGANISNFPLLSLSAFLFHVGLGSIFGLYLMYFWYLNMFKTLKYLGLIGVPTFVFGHRLLSYIASKRK